MSLRNTPDRWSSISPPLHWLVMLLVLGLGVVGLVMVELPRSPAYSWVYDLHKSFGIVVLVLVAARLAWWLFERAPRHETDPPHWQEHAASAAAQALEPGSYAIDPVHTRVVFMIEHAGFSKAIGTISGSSGTLRFDRDDWRKAQVDVTVPVSRVDLGDVKWNTAVLAHDLLDGKHYPEARFVSHTVEGIDADHARICGDLTLHGVTAPVCLDVTFNALKRHPMPPFHLTAGFSATATLSRKAFGITAWSTMIGDEVQLLIQIEAVRGHPRSPQPTAEAAPDDSASAPPAAETPTIPPEHTP